MINKIFVYGTLRPGFRAHTSFGLAENAKHLGTYEVKGSMFTLGAFPACVFGGQHTVIGDLLELDGLGLLDALDNYEGFDGTPGKHNLYNRIEINVGGEQAYTYEYAHKDELSDVILVNHGDWVKHNHG